MMHKDTSGPPCRHMEALLQDVASNRSRGLKLWYALNHAARCGRCGRFLASLRDMANALRGARAHEVESEVIQRLEEQVKASAR